MRVAMLAASDEATAGSVMQNAEPFVGQEEVPQPAAARLALELVDDGRTVPAVVQRRHLRGEDRLGRVDAFGHEVGQRLVQLAGTRVETEVHQPSRVSASPCSISGNTSTPNRSKPSPTVWPWL